MLPVELMVGIPRAVAIFYHAFLMISLYPPEPRPPHTRREGRGASRDLLRRPSRIGHPAWAGGRESMSRSRRKIGAHGAACRRAGVGSGELGWSLQMPVRSC